MKQEEWSLWPQIGVIWGFSPTNLKLKSSPQIEHSSTSISEWVELDFDCELFLFNNLKFKLVMNPLNSRINKKNAITWKNLKLIEELELVKLNQFSLLYSYRLKD